MEPGVVMPARCRKRGSALRGLLQQARATLQRLKLLPKHVFALLVLCCCAEAHGRVPAHNVVPQARRQGRIDASCSAVDAVTSS